MCLCRETQQTGLSPLSPVITEPSDHGPSLISCNMTCSFIWSEGRDFSHFVCVSWNEVVGEREGRVKFWEEDRVKTVRRKIMRLN